MTSDRRALIPLHLFLVWAAMTAAVPVVGFGLVVAGWGGGAGAAALLVALGVPLTVGLLAVVGTSARALVPLCASVSGRLGWALMVFVPGTLGVLAGVGAYAGDVDLGSAGARIVLVGVPYAVAAAFFVPSRWARLGAVTALAAGVAYGGFIGPARSREHRHEAEIVRYREHTELLYLGTAPPGMVVSRAEAGPASFTVEYRSDRQDSFAYVGLSVRPPVTPALQCPEFLETKATCAVDAHGEMRMTRPLTGGHDITLVRRVGKAEATVGSQTLDEPGLRQLLDSLRPLSDAELEELMREKKIDRRF